MPLSVPGRVSMDVCGHRFNDVLAVRCIISAAVMKRASVAGKHLHRLCRAILAGLLLASVPALAAEPARVVILVGADPIQPAALVQIKALRNMLETSAPHGAEVYLDAIDGFRFGTDDLSPEFLALLKKSTRLSASIW
ncbi:hypothetical protein M3I54_29940 [Paraburkholderia sp. CNPSo 3274]|uniref:hypothetical protein n=1 Tax=Paraburkholderia sp. CNPSo 3274 TaxID=2940932 RepID=UPI0020B816FE|nr:hypothetical protein [Paraburkholderia sp. CNPSo 3274]MCP3711147.1 hypothetical protein [Paraburkholderia sp. CNPSo 3274]